MEISVQIVIITLVKESVESSLAVGVVIVVIGPYRGSLELSLFSLHPRARLLPWIRDVWSFWICERSGPLWWWCLGISLLAPEKGKRKTFWFGLAGNPVGFQKNHCRLVDDGILDQSAEWETSANF